MTRHVSTIAAASFLTKPVAPAFPQTAEGWKAEFAASPDLRREFGSVEHYANYMQGVAAGRVRILDGGCRIGLRVARSFLSAPAKK